MNDLKNFIPTNEPQYTPNFDTAGCTDYSFQNLIETKINFMIYNGLLSDQALQFLIDNGYIIKR